MNKRDREKFKKLLIDEKKRILRHLDELSGDSEEQLGGGSAGDPADIASTEISQASLQKIGKRETFLLKKIDYSLQKIEDGSYGECESCGEQIGVKRLMARPVAQLCIDCKTEQETAEKRFQNWEPNDEEYEGFETES
jgi:DnaK suppressor protein